MMRKQTQTLYNHNKNADRFIREKSQNMGVDCEHTLYSSRRDKNGAFCPQRYFASPKNPKNQAYNQE